MSKKQQPKSPHYLLVLPHLLLALNVFLLANVRFPPPDAVHAQAVVGGGDGLMESLIYLR
jgi:hypothetical protein